MHIDQQMEIAARAERVWEVMIDVQRWPEWTPTVTSVERLDAGLSGEAQG
jgi:carbon monoxide dehydrogenase subunit G